MGQASGYPILCGVRNINDPCNGNSQLFTLKSHSNPKEIEAKISALFVGASSDMLMQSSGGSTYIPFADLLKKLPSAE